MTAEPPAGPRARGDAPAMRLPGLDEAAADVLRVDVVGLLTRLIRADTSNPPGDASPAADVLREYFAAHGVALTVVGEDATLPDCVARLEGRGTGPSLLLLGHLDVVPADAGEWSVPPFAGIVRDGYVWGRGALDMKHQVAAQAVAFVRLARAARAGHALAGDLIFAATADEETGARCGARWLFEHHPELVRADYVVNEGGLDTFPLADDGRLHTVNIGEKGYANCRLTLRGRAAHGSVPLRHDNVVLGVAEVIDALARYEPQVSGAYLPRAVVETVVDDREARRRLLDPATAQAAVRELGAQDPAAAAVVEPALGMTFATTQVRTFGDAVNVVPSTAEIMVDCRVLPGQSADDVRRELVQALAGVRISWEAEVVDFMPGSASPAASPLFDAIAATMAELRPDSRMTATLLSAFTDCVHVRAAFPGVVAYGFCPFVVEGGTETRPRVHGADERITVDDLVFQTVFTERLARRLLG